MWTIFLLLLSLSVNPSLSLVCEVIGNCDQGTIVDASTTPSYNDCLKDCQSNPTCNWVTFDSGINRCFSFFDCPDINPACPSCTSGEKLCPLQKTCHAPGFCQGQLVGYNITASYDHCVLYCKETKECGYFTFDVNDRSCFLTDTCDFLDESCDSCFYGEKACFEEELVGNTKLFVILGTAAHVIDLSGDTAACRTPAALPVGMEFGAGAMVAGKPMVCGSWLLEDQQKCFVYTVATDSWEQTDPMIMGRYDAAAVSVNNGDSLWVTGGYGSEPSGINGVHNTTEIFTPGGQGFALDIELPEIMDNHCALKINESLFLFHTELGTSWLLDKSSMTWTALPDLPFAPRKTPICGLVNDYEMVVTGGEVQPGVFSVASYKLSLEERFWVDVADLPTGMRAETVQFSGGFVTVGGFDGSSYTNKLFRFDRFGDWSELEQKLPVTGFGLVAFMVDDAAVNCG